MGKIRALTEKELETINGGSGEALPVMLLYLLGFAVIGVVGFGIYQIYKQHEYNKKFKEDVIKKLGDLKKEVDKTSKQGENKQNNI